MQIYLRKATLADVPEIMTIIDQAKAYLKSYGSPQWQDGHPNLAMIQDDIQHHYTWVLMVNGIIAGTAALKSQSDQHYTDITDGHWNKPDEPYTVIHRVAVSTKIRGQHLGKFLFATLISVGLNAGIKNFRYDTHRMNLPMQKLGENMGFVRRGTIYVDDKIDPKRIGYELNL